MAGSRGAHGIVPRAKALTTSVAAFVRRHPRAAVYALSIALHLLVAPFLIHDWDGYVFVETARDMLQGRSPYATVEAEPPYIFVGDAVPVVNSWYAYPPIALLLFTPFFALTTALSAAPWAERMGIKLPLILGDLLLAYVAAELVRTLLRARADPAADRRAAWTERALLLNPFVIFIGAAWGMFDAWMFVFLLASLLMLARGRLGAAGALFALAALVKPFAAILGPLLLAHVLLAHGRRQAVRFVGSGIVAGLAVCLPFFLDAPQGFLQQVVLNHAQRPPQGFTLVGLPLAFGWINGLTGLSLPAHYTPEHVGSLSFALLVALLVFVYAKARETTDVARLVTLGLATLAGMLVVSKVVNEQYFLMPVTLAAVAFALTGAKLHRRLFFAYSAGGLVSGLLLGWHFVTFLPPDVAARVFPFDPLEAVPRIRGVLGWNDEQAYVYPTLLAAASLVPALLLTIRLLVVELGVALPRRGLAAARALVPRAAAIALVLALFTVLPAATTALVDSSRSDAPAHPPLPDGDGRLVGVSYHMWWHNPSHDPRLEQGNWRRGASQVPVEGYYTISAGKMQNDFRAMRESGIDVLLVSYHDFDRPKLPAVARLTREAGLLVAPLVDLSEIALRADHQPRDANGNGMGFEAGLSLRNETADEIVRTTADALTDLLRSESAWHRGGAPVVLFDDADHMGFDASGEGRTRLEAIALRLAREDAAAGRAGEPDEAAILAAFPAETGALDAAGPYSALYRRAYDEAYRAFWQDVRAQLEERFGPLYLMGRVAWSEDGDAARGTAVALGAYDAFDATFLPPPGEWWREAPTESFDERVARWEARGAAKAQHDRGAGAPVTVTLSPSHDDVPARGATGVRIPAAHDDVSTYSRLWDAARALEPDLVLVSSWNQYYEGSAIEPTRGVGETRLRETREQSDLLHAPREAAPGPRVLLVTNHRGAEFEPRVGVADWTAGLSLDLQGDAHRLWGARVDAVEWNGVAAARLGDYDLVVVEPGAAQAWTADAAALPDALQARLLEGGRVLLLGSYVGPDFARLATWGESAPLGEGVALETSEGDVALAATDRLREHAPPEDADVRLWLRHAEGRAPALWTLEVGDGRLGVTAFKPTQTAAPGSTPLLGLLVAEARLLPEGTA